MPPEEKDRVDQNILVLMGLTDVLGHDLRGATVALGVGVPRVDAPIEARIEPPIGAGRKERIAHGCILATNAYTKETLGRQRWRVSMSFVAYHFMFLRVKESRGVSEWLDSRSACGD